MKWNAVGALALLVIGIGIGALGMSKSQSEQVVTNTKPTSEKNAPVGSEALAVSRTFLNAAVNANLGKHFIINFLPLKQQIIEIQKKYKQKTNVYFNYLNNASWVGLNEKDSFTAASTVKAPLAMSVYKLAEAGKIDLDAKYSLEQADLDDHFGELYKIGADRAFTIEELMQIMLEHSDNTAMNALYKIVQLNGISDPFQDVYTFLGRSTFSDFGEGGIVAYRDINLKTLSNMFIALYDAHYINAEHSNQLLQYLSNSPFNNKIVAGVPAGIPISHKEGIYTPNNTYSDCGIVYIPNRNYILCMSMEGGNEDMANRFMSEVSKATYIFVANN